MSARLLPAAWYPCFLSKKLRTQKLCRTFAAMADNITFHQYNNLHDIEDSWRSLDQQAERLSLGYIHYTYYQTYEWNEFLYHPPSAVSAR